MPLFRIEVGPREDQPNHEVKSLANVFGSFGFQAPADARTARLFWLEGDFNPDQLSFVASNLLADPISERASIDTPLYPQNGRADVYRLEIVKKPGVMDPVVGHLRKALNDHGLDASFCATGRQFLFFGNISREHVETVARKALANECIEEIHLDRDAPVHKVEGATPFALRVVPLLGKTAEELEQLSRDGCLSLNLHEMRCIQAHFAKLGRNPTDIELESIAQTWSEHCVHKTLRGKAHFTGPDGQTRMYDNILKQTIAHATSQLAHPDCLSVFKDNAGAVRFDERWALTFKAETHNHPSAIEPYGGAGTGIGGVIRDTLGTGLGAKPIANTDVFCFGMPDLPMEQLPPGTLHPRRVMQGVVSGVRDYGNRMGIPTVNGAVHFDPRYVGNPLVYAGSIGIIPSDKLEKAAQTGDYIVALGGRTGRDGIHGATFSSIELTQESEKVSSGAVQIGNPIEEKKIRDVLLMARDEGLFRAVTDCGAGGFSSAVGEMGEHTGAEVELERAPLKYAGLSYTEIWISEAQERMVLAVPPEHWARLQALCAEEQVEATIIGRFTSDRQLTLRYKGTLVGQLSMDFLHNGVPQLERKAAWNGPAEAARQPLLAVASNEQQFSFGALLKKILAHPTVASKESIVRQYDHEVQGRTAIKPLVGVNADGPGDAAVLTPLLDSVRGAIIANGLCPQFTDLDPREMARLAVDEAVRNAIAVGGDPSRMYLLDNFSWGNPANPEQLGSLILACEGATEAAIAYGAPFISGKDSLNNEYAVDGRRIAIPGTLLISVLSIVDDVRQCITMDLKTVGNPVYLVGLTRAELGASHAHLLQGKAAIEGAVPRSDLELAIKTYRALHAAIKQGILRSCHDLSEGGLAVAASEMAFAGGLGLALELNRMPLAKGETLNAFERLFSESPSRFLIEVPIERTGEFEAALLGVPFACIGSVTEAPFLRIAMHEGEQTEMLIDEPLEALKQAWQTAL